jgi:hypothetical protein
VRASIIEDSRVMSRVGRVISFVWQLTSFDGAITDRDGDIMRGVQRRLSDRPRQEIEASLLRPDESQRLDRRLHIDGSRGARHRA